MKRYIAYCITTILFIAASCDSARYPIDNPPSVKIDVRLLGTWKEKGKREEFTLIKQNDNEYTILYRNRRHDDIEKYPAFLSSVENTEFLNVCLPNEEGKEYIFLKIIEINPIRNVVTVAGVSDSTMKYITDAAGIRDRITQNLNNPAFYSDTTYFYRISK